MDVDYVDTVDWWLTNGTCGLCGHGEFDHFVEARHDGPYPYCIGNDRHCRCPGWQEDEGETT